MISKRVTLLYYHLRGPTLIQWTAHTKDSTPVHGVLVKRHLKMYSYVIDPSSEKGAIERPNGNRFGTKSRFKFLSWCGRLKPGVVAASNMLVWTLCNHLFLKCYVQRHFTQNRTVVLSWCFPIHIDRHGKQRGFLPGKGRWTATLCAFNVYTIVNLSIPRHRENGRDSGPT